MNGQTLEIRSGSVEQTIEIGRVMGGALAPGDVVALVGPLGSGKTHLTKGIAAGLGVADGRGVNSPTFVIVNEYVARPTDGRPSASSQACTVFHVDAYRLSGADELAAAGFDEMCDGRGVVVVEWADRVRAAIPAGAAWIEIVVAGETERVLRFGGGNLARRLAVQGLSAARDG